MFGFDRIWHEITRELSELSREFIIWVERLSDAEKIIALCVFIIALFLLTVRLAGGKKRDRSETVQFVFAMALVILFGYGAGWMFSEQPALGALQL